MLLRTATVACIALLSSPALAMDRDPVGTVVASVDRCPDAVETPNGFADHDGCPDTAPAPVATTRLAGMSLRQVHFDVGAAEVSEVWQAALAAAVSALRADPSLHLEIVGHAEPREGTTPDGLRALSKRRAELVRAALVRRHGVDPSRLSVRAAGDGEPIDSNRTARGRRINRRVEFTPILGAGPR